jgi:hypothetical protein
MQRSALRSLCLILAVSSCATSDHRDEPKRAASTQPTMEEMFAAMERAGTPGAAHKKLEPFVGTWDAHVKMWPDPAAPAMESTGTMVNEWVFGGRFLKHKFTGDMGGQPFEGGGLWGYDVAAGKYVGVWVDSMSTGIMTSSGPDSADGKTFKSIGIATDPMTGRQTSSEEVITLDGPDQHTMRMFEQRGKDRVQTMEVVYTRAKSK